MPRPFESSSASAIGREEGSKGPSSSSDHDHDGSVDHDRPPKWRFGRSPLAALAGIALVLAGVGGLFVAGAADAPVEARTVGGNLPVNAGANDPGDLSANNSPVVAVDPTDASHVVVANRIDTPRFSCALHLSSDGGSTFTQRPIPVPAAAEEPKCYAPDVAFGADGTFYLLFVTLIGRGNRPNRVWLSTSDDGGQTLSPPTEVLGKLAFQVGLTADPQVPGKLYLTWLQAAATATLAFPDTGYPINVATSDDGGQNWSDPVRVSAASRERVVAPSLAVGPDGTLHVLYLDLGDDRLDWAGAHSGIGGPPYDGQWHMVAARSGDGGTTWTESPVGDVAPFSRILVFLPDFPSLAVDRDSGALYAAFEARQDGDADVLVWRSDDDGASWQDPVQVNHTPADDGSAQYLPQVSVAPGGRVDVVYYDRRADPDNVNNEVAVSYSTDGARTFADRVVVSDRAFSSQIGFNSVNNLAQLGARLGLVSTADRALPVWTDTRAGTVGSGKQDIVRQLVGFRDPDRLSAGVRTGLRGGGLVVAIVGGMLMLWWAAEAVRRRRNPVETTGQAGSADDDEDDE